MSEGGTKLKQVKTFQYVGSTFNKDVISENEIKKGDGDIISTANVTQANYKFKYQNEKIFYASNFFLCNRINKLGLINDVFI